jgi:hypothetical protein
MNFKNILTKKNIFTLLIILWLIFSVYYVIQNEWQKYKIGQLEKAYIAGGNNAVNIIINEAKKCQQIPLVSGDKRVNMIAVECLQNNQKKSNSETTK